MTVFAASATTSSTSSFFQPPGGGNGAAAAPQRDPRDKAYVSATDDYMVVADMGRRLLAVKLNYHEEEIVAVP